MATAPLERDSGAESIASPDNRPLLVRAVHGFRGANNDELIFAKGDIITVTQQVDGGWWEGTISGKTGWFPSNYVKPCDLDPNVNEASSTGGCQTNDGSGAAAEASRHQYHNVILNSIIETETGYVNELRDLWGSFLMPLRSADALPSEAFAALAGNLVEIIDFNGELRDRLEEAANLPLHKQRVGGVFLAKAAEAKAVYERYFSNHPVAVETLDAYREDIRECLESLGAEPPGDRFLTHALSLVFRRLDKYAPLLKELERNLEPSHADRGDTQRAISVYRDMVNACQHYRKQKELELHVFNSDVLHWDGPSISALGEVLLLTQVSMIIESGQPIRRDGSSLSGGGGGVSAMVLGGVSSGSSKKLSCSSASSGSISHDDGVDMEVGATGSSSGGALCSSSPSHNRPGSSSSTHRDHLLILFPQTLLILKITHRMSGFIFHSQLPLAGIVASPLCEEASAAVPPEAPYCPALEISGSSLGDQKLEVRFTSKSDRDAWVDGLQGNAPRPPVASLQPPPKPNRESASALLDALVADAAAAFVAASTSSSADHEPTSPRALSLSQRPPPAPSKHGIGKPPAPSPPQSSDPPPLPPYPSSMSYQTVSCSAAGSATLPAPSSVPPPSFFTVLSATLPAQMSPPIVPVHRPQWTLSCLRPSPPIRGALPWSISSVTSSSTALSASPPPTGLASATTSSSPLLDAIDTTKSPRALRRMVHATLPRRKHLYERQKSDEEFGNRNRFDEVRAYDDAEVLKVIESYCTSAKTRHTVNSLDLTKLSLEEREHALGGVAAQFSTLTRQHHGIGCRHHLGGGTGTADDRQPITAPDFLQHGRRAGGPGGFCCGAFPITKGIVKGLKRL